LSFLFLLNTIYNRYCSQFHLFLFTHRRKVNPFRKIRSTAKNTGFLNRVPSAVRRAPLVILACALSMAALATAAQAASVELQWDPNTEPQLAGYKVYWGTSSASFTFSKNVGNTTVCTVTGLDEGQTYYFAATAYDAAGTESGYSNQVSYSIPLSDSDGDGVPDNQDAFPSNPAETIDTDEDGIGNNADPDDDNDRMPDEWELQYGLNPLTDDASDDLDGDGRSNLDEYLAGTDPAVPQNNFAPDAPTLAAPVNQQVVDLTPELKANPFLDPNAGDFHSATQWKIYRKSDNVCIFDITSEHSLTRLEVPKLILRAESDYLWQARYYDNHGIPSPWSGTGSFTTRSSADDTNNNGIPDGQEVDTPSDLDGDGRWDSNQNTIKCVKTATGKALGIGFKDAGTVVEIESISVEEDNGSEISAAAAGNSVQFPFGLINFKLIMRQPGDQAEITIYFSEPAPKGGRWLKYDPMEATWTDYTNRSDLSAGRQSVTLYLEDGGEGDADGSANGIIVDPSGLGVSSASLDSGGGGGGIPGANACFISALSSQPDGNPPASLWSEIRGRELAILLVLLAVLKVCSGITRRARHRWEELQRRYEAFDGLGSSRFTASDIITVQGSRRRAQGKRPMANGTRQ
jgi:chitinase